MSRIKFCKLILNQWHDSANSFIYVNIIFELYEFTDRNYFLLKVLSYYKEDFLKFEDRN